ncbi:MAG: PP2C family protein-serine/threonine phosphatase [Phycisphaerae bacterium]
MATSSTEAELLRPAGPAPGNRPEQDAMRTTDPLGMPGSQTGPASIVVADDDPDARALTRHLLKKAGYEVLEAEDGEQVLAMLEQRMPELILLDCQMPRLDGFSTCLELKKNPNYADLPVIFLTVRSDPSDKARGFAVGGEDYITKPIERQEFLARVRSRLELSRYRRELRRRATVYEAVSIESADRLEDVRDGQVSLLTQPNSLPDLKLGVRFQPAHEAGGDFYEIARLCDDEFGFLVSDVSGHDLSVPFITGALKALAATFLNESLTPLEVLSLHNSSLLKFLSEGRYVTACCARFSRSTMEVEVANAAHPPPFFQSAKHESTFINLSGDILGMLETARFESTRFPVEPGDRLFLYTDGLIESGRGPDGRWGVVRGMVWLKEALLARSAIPINQVVDSVVDELLCDCGGKAEDDIVLMGIEF